MAWNGKWGSDDLAAGEADMLASPDEGVRRFYKSKVAMRALQDATTNGSYGPCGACGGTGNAATDGRRFGHCKDCSGTGREEE